MKKTKRSLVSISFIALLFITSCAPSGVTEHQHGIFYGLLHGALLPFELIAKLFSMDYDLYAANNTGFWYWIGYIIGVSVWTGGGCAMRRRR
jgi:hypothetical protein